VAADFRVIASEQEIISMLREVFRAKSAAASRRVSADEAQIGTRNHE
jgi:hypothetical protein